MLNMAILPYEALQRSAQRQSIDLDPGLPTDHLKCVIEGSLTVATDDDQKLADDYIERLIPRVRLDRDGKPLIRDIPMRDLAAISRRSVQQEARGTEITADGAGLLDTGTYPFKRIIRIPFATDWSRNAWNTHLPALGARNGLTLYIDWDTTKANATSAIGTGALIDPDIVAPAGVLTWAVEPKITVFQVGAPFSVDTGNKPGARPVGVRSYEQFRIPTWTAATVRLAEEIRGRRMTDLMLFRSTYGADEKLEDSIRAMSLLASGREFMRDASLDFLKSEESEYFPAVNDETGYLALLFGARGMLTGALEPAMHTNLRHEFSLAEPTAGEGLITVTHCQVIRSESE